MYHFLDIYSVAQQEKVLISLIPIRKFYSIQKCKFNLLFAFLNTIQNVWNKSRILSWCEFTVVFVCWKKGWNKIEKLVARKFVDKNMSWWIKMISRNAF